MKSYLFPRSLQALRRERGFLVSYVRRCSLGYLISSRWSSHYVPPPFDPTLKWVDLAHRSISLEHLHPIRLIQSA